MMQHHRSFYKYPIATTSLLLAFTVPALRAQSQSPDKQPVAPYANEGGGQTTHTYRVTYTVTESDAGKRTGVQHYAMTAVSNLRTTMKHGSKNPVMTGGVVHGGASDGTQFEFTYLDVGLNLDATILEGAEGLQLKSKVELSSIVDSVNPQLLKDPVVLQTVLENSARIKTGTAVVIGSLDLPDSTRHLDIEVTLDRLS